jgi:glycine/D-amino acid oxidase-like deaminating enzyme/nitrite reductase/ring-hydroxylating ferredoxin subunit
MGSLREANPSLWLPTAPTPDYPSLREARPPRVDVAVVGSGITGLSAATLLKATGATVAVLEAGRVCSGVTAYTTAKVSSLHGLTYAHLVSSLGEERARGYGEANQAAIERIAQFVRDREIDCDFSRRPAYTYTTDPAAVGKIEAEVAAAQRLGLPASFTTDTDLPYEVAAAVRFDDQAQFHPRRYCLALAAAIPGDDSHLFERTRATGVDEGSPCVVRTEAGPLEADHVVLATHLPFLDRGGFFAKCHPSRSYALAARLDGAVPTGMYLSVDSPTRSVRAALGDEFVILGGEGHRVGEDADTRRRYQALEAWARQHFGIHDVTHRWSAQDYTPVDGVPFVGPLVPGSRILVATGFNKWGMTNGTAAAVILADLIAGRHNPWAEVFDATRLRSLATGKLLTANVGTAQHFVRDRLSNLRPRPAEELGPGEGAIATLGGRKVAAYRDDEGALHTVSPVCTHQYCLVSFNTAERTWDCPCHGSRYTVDGEVLEGPAVKDLEGRS